MGVSEKKCELLANIMRASHFEWRRAVMRLCPDLDRKELIKRYWAEVGKDTSRYYLSRIDPNRDLATQVAGISVASSVAMSEDAEVAADSPGGCVCQTCTLPMVRLAQAGEASGRGDRLGCDHWLRTVVEGTSAVLDRSLQFETVESLPGGGSCCQRGLWESNR